MTAEEKKISDRIKAKLIAGMKLSREEDLFYLEKIVGLPKENAVGVLKVNSNQKEGLILD